jgi:branched-chain amino acid transport system ATP-binding protein
MTALLDVADLSASYGPSKVLHGLSFSVETGQIVALLGANGAGKTTTLRAICSLVRTGGQVRFSGERIEKRTTEDIARLRIGHVPDGRGTFKELTVEENMRMGAYVRKDREVAADFEKMFGYFPKLKERYKQQAGTLSGGEQQMLAIARALLLRPKLLLLDEPSIGLAPLIVREIFSILQRINTEDGVSMLIVEQNANLALSISSFAYLLETGRIVLSGTAHDIMQNDAVRRSYLGY